jgi:type II secretory pathway pseudopilin PulG
MRERRELVKPDRAGSSLVEAIVAIAIISVVAISSVALTTDGVSTAAAQKRRKIAVTIVSGAVEAVSAQTAANPDNGRPADLVRAEFLQNSTVPGVAAPSAGGTPTHEGSDTSPPRQALVAPTGRPYVDRSGTKFSSKFSWGLFSVRPRPCRRSNPQLSAPANIALVMFA